MLSVLLDSARAVSLGMLHVCGKFGSAHDKRVSPGTRKAWQSYSSAEHHPVGAGMACVTGFWANCLDVTCTEAFVCLELWLAC